MCSRAILVVPPFLKYTAGPLLGPALLQSSALRAGHECSVLDLNAKYLFPKVKKRRNQSMFLGDHDKPSILLNQIENEFYRSIMIGRLQDNTTDGGISSMKFGYFSHQELEEKASSLLDQPHSFGTWVHHELSKWESYVPKVVGISLLHAGQLIPATVTTMIARQIWPKASIVWGGPHISGLGERALRQDICQRSFAADIFVTGHAEKTFIDLLNTTWSLSEFPVVLNGNRGNLVLPPTFDSLKMYDEPYTFPAQSTLGCSYGKCTYCTYPAIEDVPTRLDLEISIRSVIESAKNYENASVAIKDSLATPLRLKQLARCINNKVKWSACTKLSSKFDQKALCDLYDNGLRTLEIGLESLLPETQSRIRKIQPQSLFEDFINEVSSLPNEDLTLVINYMIGFPWEDRNDALEKLEETRNILENNLGHDRAMIELNTFELERLSQMAKFPELYGITNVRSWPWASVLKFDRINK